MKITDDQINMAFAGCDFGPTVKTTEERKRFLAQKVFALASGYTTGSTVDSIMRVLKLVYPRAERPHDAAMKWAHQTTFFSENNEH